MIKTFSTIVTLLSLLFLATPSHAQTATATFAGGCFWCMEQVFEAQDGVKSVVSGFTGGTLQNPTYRGDHTGHYEAIEVSYNPEQVTYQALLDLYWKNVDPFDDSGQFCDKGFSYRAAIFPGNEAERAQAVASKEAVQRRFAEQNVVTQILDANRFWPVEEYHQDYYLKNPLRYRYYKGRCGRTKRLEQVWGKK